MKDDTIRDMLDMHELHAELERVCPEAQEGLAVAGPRPPRLSHAELADVLRALPDDAGVEAVRRAWSEAVPNGDASALAGEQSGPSTA